MVDAFTRDLAVARRLSKNECAPQHGLGMRSKTGSAPTRFDSSGLHRRPDIGLERDGVPEDAGCAGFEDRRRRAINLLRHGADETGEIGEVAVDDVLAEIHIPKQAIERVVMTLAGSIGNQGPGGLGDLSSVRSH